MSYNVVACDGHQERFVSDFVACSTRKFVLSSGKLASSGISSHLDEGSSSYLEIKKTRRRIPVVMRRNSFYIRAAIILSTVGKSLGLTVAPIGSATSSSAAAPFATSSSSTAAPLASTASSSGLLADVQLMAQGESDEVMSRIVQPTAAVPVAPPAAASVVLGPTADVGSLRTRLKELGAAVYGAKAELYTRLVAAEAKTELQRREREWLEVRRAELASGAKPQENAQLTVPDSPSDDAVRKHEDRQHLPPEPWCLNCLLSRSSAAPHSTIPASKPTVPRFELGFTFYTSNFESIEVEKGVPTEKPWITTLTIVDKPTQTPLHISVPSKSVKREQYMAVSSSEFIRRMAYQEAELRIDGEPASLVLAEEIKSRVKPSGINLTIKCAPRYSSASLGAVGKAQDMCARQVRTIKTDFEQRYGMALHPDDVLWPWLVRHSGWCVEHLHIRGNGATSYEDSFGSA